MLIAPATEADVAQAVLDARAACTPLAIEGGGTRRGLGRPSQAGRTLSLRNLSGITLYEPSEMVIGAWAGTPLAQIQQTLDERGQMLAFEPMDHRSLLASEGEPTIGAVAACNISGPRRVTAGGARDSLIGVRFVNGRGEIIKNGGRVMKNVTGLDLVKLQAGAFGTLGVLTEVIFKVLPKPATVATLVFHALSDAEGIALLCDAMNSPFEPTGAAHLPAGSGASRARTVLRIEGFPEQITYRSGELARRLNGGGAPDLIQGAAHDSLWRDIRDGAFVGEPRTDAVWRISVAPTHAAGLVESIRAKRPVNNLYYDWSGGLIWLSTSEDDGAGAELVQSAAAKLKGHATLVRGSDALRAAIPVFQPPSSGVDRIEAGIKASFDPDGILNPGRMTAGV
jgi:glycolate oxidase FAD binding subunit